MQPYFFPYIGYFQLMANCDVFVIHDDVQFIKRGWIHRNRILVNGKAQWLTRPVAAAPHEAPINGRFYDSAASTVPALARRLEGAYRSASHFKEGMSIVEEVLADQDLNVAAFNTRLLGVVARRLDIGARIECSSCLKKNDALRAQDRVVDICRTVGASTYINPIGGVALYDAPAFDRFGIELRFLNPLPSPYAQGSGDFVPSLSIIDVLMFTGVAGARALLEQCRLLRPDEATAASSSI